MQKSIIICIVMGFFLLSCEKATDNQSGDRIIGRYFDQELIGKWTMNYSTRDMNNTITSWTDSIRFEENNFGNQKTYRFSVLDQDISFLYYTDKDSLFLIQDKNIERWIYTIRNDSLFMSTSLPSYSSYYGLRVYIKSE